MTSGRPSSGKRQRQPAARLQAPSAMTGKPERERQRRRARQPPRCTRHLPAPSSPGPAAEQTRRRDRQHQRRQQHQSVLEQPSASDHAAERSHNAPSEPRQRRRSRPALVAEEQLAFEALLESLVQRLLGGGEFAWFFLLHDEPFAGLDQARRAPLARRGQRRVGAVAAARSASCRRRRTAAILLDQPDMALDPHVDQRRGEGAIVEPIFDT